MNEHAHSEGCHATDRTVAQLSDLDTLAQGNVQLCERLDRHRERLRKIVAATMDQRLHARLDASDVIQETFLEAMARIEEYRAEPRVSLFVWLRFLAKQRLAILYRQHVLAQVRDVRREVSMQRESNCDSTARALAAQVAARLTTASATLRKKELQCQIQSALGKLDDKSREMLILRHFEQLTNQETSEVLQISTTAACNRYVRAIERLKRMLFDVAGDVL